METNLEQQSPKLNVTNVSSAVFGKEEGATLGKESSIGKLSRILRTTRLKVNEVEKSITGISAKFLEIDKKITLNTENITGNTKKTETNAEKITRLKNILQNQKSKIGEKLPGSTEEKEKAKLNTTLTETNRILVEIQKQLAYDFAMRVAEDKQEVAEDKEATSKKRFKREESALEKSAKAMVSTVKTATKKIVSPIGNIFEKLLAFIGILGKGIAVNAAFDWFKDPENRKKLTKFFNILKENWKALALIIGVIAGGALIANIAGFVAGLGGLVSFLLNPATLAILTTLAAAVYAMTAKSSTEMVADILGDGDDNKRREMIKGFEKMRDMSDDEIKQYTKEEPGGFRSELNKQIYFLKTGRQLLSDRGGFIDFRSYKDMANDAKFEPDLDFSKYIDKGARLQGMFEAPPQVPKRKPEARAMGGPVTAGKTYLVGERGPELVKFSENGQVINNMQTEKIYQMLSAGKKGRTRIVELPPQTIEGPKPEIKMPRGPATKAPKISSSNSLDGYRSVSSGIYGIMV